LKETEYLNLVSLKFSKEAGISTEEDIKTCSCGNLTLNQWVPGAICSKGKTTVV